VASTSDVLFKVGSATGVVNRVVSSTIDSTVLVVTTPSRSAGPQAAAVSFVSSGSDLANPATGTLTFTCRKRDREYRVRLVDAAEAAADGVEARLAALLWSGDAA
jgi:hypothetical protein